MRFRAVPSLIAASLIAGGCLHDDTMTTVTVRETLTETGAGTVPNEAPMVLTVFLLKEGKVAPVQRAVITSPQVAGAALAELLRGPTEEEAAAGFETAIPSGTEHRSARIRDGVATVELSSPLTEAEARAQLVYTLTQFPTVRRVAFPAGAAVGRASFETQTPAVLVLSPLPGEEVEPGFEVTGTANTFEATFEYELKDAAGRILTKDFVTATSGSGTRGTFEFTVPYEVAESQQGVLTVFEVSAANGARTHESSIPLRLR